MFPGRLNIHVDPEMYRFVFGVIEIVSGECAPVYF